MFQVGNGEPAASTCGVGPVMTHAASGASVTVTKKPAAGGGWSFTNSTYATGGTTTITRPTPAGTGSSQRTAVFTYDLSFMQAPAGLAAASLWVYVTSDGGAAGATLEAWDAPGAVPCVEAPCVAVRPGTPSHICIDARVDVPSQSLTPPGSPPRAGGLRQADRFWALDRGGSGR
jgi:hypothetical protein